MILRIGSDHTEEKGLGSPCGPSHTGTNTGEEVFCTVLCLGLLGAAPASLKVISMQVWPQRLFWFDEEVATSSGDEKLVDTKGDEDLVDKIQSVDCETMDLGRQRFRVRHDESSSERTAVRGLRKMCWWRRWRRNGVISQRKQCALGDGHEIRCFDSDVASLLQTPIFTHTENDKNIKMVKKDETLPTCFLLFPKQICQHHLGR